MSEAGLGSRFVVLCLVAGVMGGLSSGLLGIGGGVVMIPLLVLIPLSQHDAHATSLAAIIPIAAVGAIAYLSQDDVGIGIAVALAAGALVGAPLGASLMERMSERKLNIVFTILQVCVGSYLLVT